MSLHRSSYKKTIILATVIGTVSLLLGTFVLSLHVIPILLTWIGGSILFFVTLGAYAVALGGVLALHNDAKGRAYF